MSRALMGWELTPPERVTWFLLKFPPFISIGG
ncbi:hypothetical protein ES703_68062 [subsurface metagenome]